MKVDSEKVLRGGLAIGAGLLQAAAFPKISLAGGAWVAPGLLLLASAGLQGRGAFWVGWLGGFAYALGAFYWLLLIPVKVLPILGWAALGGYLGLYSGLWVWLGWKILPRAAEDSPTRKAPLAGLIDRLLSVRWVVRFGWFLSLAALWVALEMLQARFLSGFPWNFLGVSQYRFLPLIQISSFTGVYGISFLVVWFSVTLFSALALLTRFPANKTRWAGEIVPPILVITAACFFGMRRIVRYEPPSRTLKAALIQPSIPQTLIWDEKENNYRFEQLLKLSEEALKQKPDLLIWPEASVPNMIRHDKDTAEAVINLTTKHKIWLILGSDDAEPHPGAKTYKDADYYNSSFAISPEGALAGIYRKRRLVIFGEYVPFVKWLPFLQNLSGGDVGFTPGEKAVAFALKDLKITTSVLICFEDTFPHLVPEYAIDGVDFLLNLTNNGWFGESAAQWQHAANAIFRAVENNIPLVRCANNGLTCWVDELGRMHDIYFPGSIDVYKAGYKVAEVPILQPQEHRQRTFYNEHGDFFGWGCVLWTCAALGFMTRRSKSNLPPTEPVAD